MNTADINKCKALIIMNSFRLGGTEKCSIELAIALMQQGYEVHFGILESEYELNPPLGAYIHEIGSQENNKVQAWLESFYQSKEPSLVIVADTHINLKLSNTEIYYALHIVPSERIDGGIIRKIRKRRRWRNRLKDKNIIAVSSGVYNDVINVIKAKPRSIRVIHNAFNFPIIEKLSHEQVDYDLPSEYILYAGRFSSIKRLDRLIDIYKNSGVSVPLVLLGQGEKYSQVLELISAQQLSSKIILIGWQHNPYPAIANAKALVLTSDSESFSAIIVEALYLETPVISTDCVGPLEIMSQSLADYIIPKMDTTKFIEKLHDVLKHGQISVKNEVHQQYNFKAITSKFEHLMSNRPE